MSCQEWRRRREETWRAGGQAGGPGPEGAPGEALGPRGKCRALQGSPARRTQARAHLLVLLHPLRRREVGLRLRAQAHHGLEVGRQLEGRRPAVRLPVEGAGTLRALGSSPRGAWEGWRLSGADSARPTCTDPHVHTHASCTGTVLAQAVLDCPRVTPLMWQSPGNSRILTTHSFYFLIYFIDFGEEG